MDRIQIALFAGIGGVLLPFLLGPVLVHQKNRFPAFPSFDALSVEQVPESIRQNFQRQAVLLSYDGFIVTDYLFQTGQVPNTTMYLALLVNRASSEMAMLVDMWNVTGAATIRASYVEFSTDFSDGVNINTNNNNEVGAFRETREKAIFKFHEVQDPRALYTIHKRLTAMHRSAARPVLPPEGQEAAEVVRSMIRDLERQRQFGYCYMDTGSAAYRPTWKGAVLMTWKLVWPVISIRRVLMKRASAAALKAAIS